MQVETLSNCRSKDANIGVFSLSVVSFEKKRANKILFGVLRKQITLISCFFFLFQKRIFINSDWSNMRELFGIERMQTNLNKLKRQSYWK